VLDLERELDAVRNALIERGIEYALRGGLAVGGFPRATRERHEWLGSLANAKRLSPPEGLERRSRDRDESPHE
jgi:hypothetical protein